MCEIRLYRSLGEAVAGGIKDVCQGSDERV